MYCDVNKSLVPLKLYFFNYLAGLACIVPYMPVFAVKLGFTNGELAVIYGILPFVGLLSKPLVGIIADKLSAHRLVLLVALSVQGIFTFMVYFLPPMTDDILPKTPVHLTCNQNAATLDVKMNASAIFCASNSTAVECSFRDADYVFRALNITPAGPMPLNFVLEAVGAAANSSNANHCPSYVCDTSLAVQIGYQGVPRTTCTESIAMNCSAFLCKTQAVTQNFVRFSYQFWLFLIVMTISRVGFTAAYTIGDSVAFDLIGQQKRAVSYGTQRVFGSLGWAAAAVIVGILMDAFTEKDPAAGTDFAPAFYGFVVLIVCAMITAWFLKPSENIQSTQVLKNVLRLFRDLEFVSFSLGTFLVGMCTGLLYTYLFVYMAELEAPKLMMGLSQLFECFGEAPFMFLSSWLIARIGHHGAMTMALASFCVRYIGYSLVGAQPWWILVLELFHGPGFGLFYANMATFAHNVAPSGAVATMQGVLGGIYDGFGIALGGLIGGTIYYKYGGAVAWRSFGVGAGIAAIVYFCVTMMFQRRKRGLQDALDPSAASLQNTGALITGGGTSGYETPIPPDTPSEKERLTAS